MQINPNKFNIKEMIKEFGLPIVLVSSFSRVLRMLKVARPLVLKYEVIKHRLISNYLEKKYKKMITTEGFTNELIEKDCPIWVFWWQGYENAPSIVKSCIDSVYRNCKEHKVILITEDNFKEFVNIPDYILEKLNKGLITKQQFSDILRVSLLSDKGGVWIDATCYMFNPLPDYIYNRSYFSLHTAFDEWPWSDFFQICGKSNVYMNNMKTVFFQYWKEHNQLLAYLLIDCFMAVMYRNIPYFKSEVDSLPSDDFGVWHLTCLLDKPYDKNMFEKLRENTIFSKLSFKEERKDYVDGNETFWYHLTK